jgi:hypothetical protein
MNLGVFFCLMLLCYLAFPSCFGQKLEMLAVCFGEAHVDVFFGVQ